MTNPVLKREYTAAMRSWKIYAVIAGYVAIMAGVAAAVIYVADREAGYEGFNPQMLVTLYCNLVIFQNILVALIVPSLASGAISGERERQTLDLMLLTKISPFSILVGKLFSSLSVVLIMIVASLPVFSLIFYFGGVSFIFLFATTGFTLLFAAMLGSVSIFLSTIVKKTMIGAVWTYVFLLITVLVNMVMALFGSGIFEDSAICYFLLSFDPAVGLMSILDLQTGARMTGEVVARLAMFFKADSTTLVKGLLNTQMWIYNIINMLVLAFAALFAGSRVVKAVRN